MCSGKIAGHGGSGVGETRGKGGHFCDYGNLTRRVREGPGGILGPWILDRFVGLGITNHQSRLFPFRPLQISRFYLFCGHSPFEGTQVQDDSEHRGEGPVGHEDMIVEYEILEFATLDSHENGTPCCGERGHDALGPEF